MNADGYFPFRVFTETALPQKMTLLDTLYWVAGRVVPMPQYFYNDEVESREDDDTFTDSALSFSEQFVPLWFESSDTDRMGVSDDPRRTYYHSEHHSDCYNLRSDSLRSQLDWQFTDHKDKSGKAQFDQELGEAATLLSITTLYDERLICWKKELDDALDQYRLEIILKLRRGDLIAEGLPLKLQGHYDFSGNIHSALDALDSADLGYQDNYSKVPAAKWVSRDIDWVGSFLKSEKDVWIGVRLNTNSVINAYPVEINEEVRATQLGEVLLIRDKINDLPKRPKRVGRPSKDWESVHVRISEIIRDEGFLPDKQDALVHDLCEWYFQQFGVSIGRSTMSERVSKYYKNGLFRKSRNTT